MVRHPKYVLCAVVSNHCTIHVLRKESCLQSRDKQAPDFDVIFFVVGHVHINSVYVPLDIEMYIL